jgi:bifunctional ADP-heptose synthase (sugar kinase/adenylyltransferase)
MIMTTLYIILALFAGIWIGWKAQEILFSMTFGKMLEEAGVTNKDLSKFLDHHKDQLDLEEESELTKVEIRLEQMGDQIYAYRKDNDTFLAQGHDRAELIDRISKRINNVKLIIAEDDGAGLIRDAERTHG